MIKSEKSEEPENFLFDISIVSMGYEKRCRWISEQKKIESGLLLCLGFGYLEDGEFNNNRNYFISRGGLPIIGIGPDAVTKIKSPILDKFANKDALKILVDFSSMSREMLANVLLAINDVVKEKDVVIYGAYAPSKYNVAAKSAPIRHQGPINYRLAGWNPNPDKPLGVIFGLGCEKNLALGAMQSLEPDKAWIFYPKGIETSYDAAMVDANKFLEEIFDVTKSEYSVLDPVVARGRFESLLNAIETDYRVIAVPLGPKIFAWLSIATVIFEGRSGVGIWTFSSKEHATLSSTEAEGTIVWHRMDVSSH